MDKALEEVKSEEFKNVDYSVKAKLSGVYRLRNSIQNDCEKLVRLWEENFDFGLAKNGRFTKYEPKDEKFKELELRSRISIDIDFFTYLVVSFFDVLAKYTKFMYKKNINLSTWKFSNQKEWFLKNNDIDSIYTNYLKNELYWYDSFKRKRDSIAHSIGILIIPARKHSLFTVMFCPDFLEKTSIDVEAFVGLYGKRLSKFLEFYGSHFIKNFQ